MIDFSKFHVDYILRVVNLSACFFIFLSVMNKNLYMLYFLVVLRKEKKTHEKLQYYCIFIFGLFFVIFHTDKVSLMIKLEIFYADKISWTRFSNSSRRLDFAVKGQNSQNIFPTKINPLKVLVVNNIIFIDQFLKQLIQKELKRHLFKNSQLTNSIITLIS